MLFFPPADLNADGLLFCPDTDPDIKRWTVNTPSFGTFSSTSTLSMDNSLCGVNQGSIQPCILESEDSSDLFICVAGILSDSGTLNFLFSPNSGSQFSFAIDFGELYSITCWCTSDSTSILWLFSKLHS